MTIAVFVIVLALAAGLVAFVKKMSGLRVVVDAARADFQARVGYEYASALRPSIAPERQTRLAAGTLTHHFDIHTDGAKQVTVQSWTLAPTSPAPSAFQLVDRKLVGISAALRNLGPVKRVMTIAYPGPHATGIAELDARFALYADDPAAARRVLERPEVQRAVLALAVVSLRVDATAAIFGDPTDANVYAMGASRTDINPAPAIHTATRVHLAVAELLSAVVG